MTNPEVYVLDRVITDYWRMYRTMCNTAQSWRVDGFHIAANRDGILATAYLQAAMRAEIRRKALLKASAK